MTTIYAGDTTIWYDETTPSDPNGWTELVDGLRDWTVECIAVVEDIAKRPRKIKHNFDKPIGKRCPVGGHQPIEVKHLKRYYT